MSQMMMMMMTTMMRFSCFRKGDCFMDLTCCEIGKVILVMVRELRVGFLSFPGLGRNGC